MKEGYAERPRSPTIFPPRGSALTARSTLKPIFNDLKLTYEQTKKSISKSPSLFEVYQSAPSDFEETNCAIEERFASLSAVFDGRDERSCEPYVKMLLKDINLGLVRLRDQTIPLKRTDLLAFFQVIVKYFKAKEDSLAHLMLGCTEKQDQENIIHIDLTAIVGRFEKEKTHLAKELEKEKKRLKNTVTSNQKTIAMLQKQLQETISNKINEDAHEAGQSAKIQQLEDALQECEQILKEKIQQAKQLEKEVGKLRSNEKQFAQRLAKNIEEDLKKPHRTRTEASSLSQIAPPIAPQIAPNSSPVQPAKGDQLYRLLLIQAVTVEELLGQKSHVRESCY